MKSKTLYQVFAEENRTETLWFATAAGGKANIGSVTGWKLHAVQATDSESLEEVKDRRAICGLLPRHGWSLDLFIEDKCSRCSNALNLTGE